jgi:hypothetical protein
MKILRACGLIMLWVLIPVIIVPIFLMGVVGCFIAYKWIGVVRWILSDFDVAEVNYAWNKCVDMVWDFMYQAMLLFRKEIEL